jgi:hypothetical protein
MSPQEKLHAALRSPYNLLALSFGVALTAVYLNLLPLEIALVCEVIYLAVRAFWPNKAILPRIEVRAVPASTSASQSSAAPAPVPATLAIPVERQAPEVRRPLGGGAARLQATASQSPDEILPQIRRELQMRYEALQSSLHVIKLMSESDAPAAKEIPIQLESLIGKFLTFALHEEHLRDTLEALRDEARALGDSVGLLPRTIDGKNQPPPYLHLSSGATPAAGGDLWMQQVIREAHEYYERELADLAWRREHSFDPESNAALERRSHVILRRNKYVDQVGKMLKNVIYTLDLIGKRFEITTSELNDRAPERILPDIKAIVLQAESMGRTLEDLEPFEELEETRAA